MGLFRESSEGGNQTTGIIMHYLIAGGAGFLGSHLVKKLYNQGHKISVIDNLMTGSRDNIKFFLSEPENNFDFYEMDITSHVPYGIPKLDGIFNLASPASPVHYQNTPIHTMLTNVVGSNNLLQLAKHHDCKILQTSTSEVYGDPETSPQKETYKGSVNCFGPRACYDEGKRAAEALFYDYSRLYQTDIRVVRIFNTYGPNMCVDDGRVVSNFIVQALRNEPITIYGDGTQTRSFCFASDLIDAILCVWNSNVKTPVNIGNPTEFTMLELAEKVIQLTGSKSEISFHPLPQDDPKQRRPDISLAKSIGWVGPTISLDNGLESTVQYFRSKLENTYVFI